MYRITNTMPSIVRDDCMGVWAELSDDIGGMLPYLNAVVKEASYDPQQRSLSFRRGEKGLNITPCEISIAQAASMEHAQSTVDGPRDHANEAWGKRETITAFHKCRKEPKGKDIVKLLPQTNCKECGLPTWFAFAMALGRKQKHLKDCVPLSQAAFAEKREALIGLLRSGGPEDVIDQIAGLATSPTKKFQKFTGMTNFAGQPVKQNYERSIPVTN